MWHTALSLSHLISVQFGRSVVSDSLQLYGLQLLGSPVHHQLPELSQTHVYPVSAQQSEERTGGRGAKVKLAQAALEGPADFVASPCPAQSSKGGGH